MTKLSDLGIGIVTKPLERNAEILAGLSREQNDKAEFHGMRGYWAQGDCAFITAESPQAAISEYRRRMEEARIGISHNHSCGSIIAAKLCNSIVELSKL